MDPHECMMEESHNAVARMKKHWEDWARYSGAAVARVFDVKGVDTRMSTEMLADLTDMMGDMDTVARFSSLHAEFLRQWGGHIVDAMTDKLWTKLEFKIYSAAISGRYYATFDFIWPTAKNHPCYHWDTWLHTSHLDSIMKRMDARRLVVRRQHRFKRRDLYVVTWTNRPLPEPEEIESEDSK